MLRKTVTETSEGSHVPPPEAARHCGCCLHATRDEPGKGGPRLRCVGSKTEDGRHSCRERVRPVIVGSRRSLQAADLDKAPDKDHETRQRYQCAKYSTGRRHREAAEKVRHHAEKVRHQPKQQQPPAALVAVVQPLDCDREAGPEAEETEKIGRASCRER